MRANVQKPENVTIRQALRLRPVLLKGEVSVAWKVALTNTSTSTFVGDMLGRYDAFKVLRIRCRKSFLRDAFAAKINERRAEQGERTKFGLPLSEALTRQGRRYRRQTGVSNYSVQLRKRVDQSRPSCRMRSTSCGKQKD